MKKYLIYLIILLALPVWASRTNQKVDIDVGSLMDAGVRIKPTADSVIVSGCGDTGCVAETVIVYSASDFQDDFTLHRTIYIDLPDSVHKVKVSHIIEWPSGQSTFVAEYIPLLNIYDTVSANIVSANASSIDDGDIATIDVNVVQFSGDAGAVDNFETMLDGTGGQIFNLRGLHIRGTTGSDTALIAAGHGAGQGAFFYGGASSGIGLLAMGQSSGSGLYAYGGAAGHGFYAYGQGSGSDIRLGGDGLISGRIDSVRGVGTVPSTVALQTTVDSVLDSLGNLSIPVSDTNVSGETIAVMPGDWTQADSAGFQGGVSGLDSNKVAQAIIDVLAEHGWALDSSLHLTKMTIRADSLDTALVIMGGKGQIGAYVAGGSIASGVYYAHGLRLRGNSWGSGFYADAERGYGAAFFGGTNFPGVAMSGGLTNAPGLHICGEGTESDVRLNGDGRIRGTIDTVTYVKETGSGVGTANVTFYAKDTANDVYVSAVNIDIDYDGGGDKIQRNTVSGGYLLFNATVNDTLDATFHKAGYYFPAHEITVDSTTYVDSVMGYPYAVSSPAGSNTCNTYFYASDITADVLEKGIKAVVTLSTQHQAVEDTCNGTVIAQLEKWVKKPDPATGQIVFGLIQSSCFHPPGAIYSIEVFNKNNDIVAERTFTVPDSTTHNLRFTDY